MTCPFSTNCDVLVFVTFTPIVTLLMRLLMISTFVIVGIFVTSITVISSNGLTALLFVALLGMYTSFSL